MNAIAIPVELSSLDLLIPVGVNKYNIAVQLFKNDGITPIDQPGVPNQIVITITTLNPIFTVYIPVTEGAYFFSGIAKIFLNNFDAVCTKIKAFNIINQS